MFTYLVNTDFGKLKAKVILYSGCSGWDGIFCNRILRKNLIIEKHLGR